MDMNKQYAFWNSKEIYSYNEHTKLIIDQNTKKLYIKKTMGSEGYEIHRKICGIHHKNIAEIYDCVTDGRQCIVIEQFVSGETLETLCERQLFTEEKAVDVILQICSGLEQLHSRNIIHRDVTPSNIVLTDDGTIKLIDFDISRTAKSHVRRDTHILGTQGFAAPEQFGFKQSGVQTDIYALGVLLNYLLTGEFPSVKMHQGRLSAVISKCTEIDPENRFDNIGKLKESILGNKSGKITLEKIVLGIPGLNAQRKVTRVIAVILYIAALLFNIGMYQTYAVNAEKVVCCMGVSLFGIILPIVFYSNYLDFQSRILKNTRKKVKRMLFRIIATLSLCFGFYLIPLLP